MASRAAERRLALKVSKKGLPDPARWQAEVRQVSADVRQDITMMTTRRFWARPSLVLFGATGASCP